MRENYLPERIAQVDVVFVHPIEQKAYMVSSIEGAPKSKNVTEEILMLAGIGCIIPDSNNPATY